MGLYYNPNPPHVGAQQPLSQRKLTPPISGPAPQNPPFMGGARIAQAILTCWAVAAAVAIPTPPVVAVNLDPPISGPAPQNPPRTGARVPVEVLVSWLPAPPTPWPNFIADDVAPLVPAPIQSLPQFQRRLDQIYGAWLPSIPAPIVAVNLDPPVSGPTPQNPPVRGARVPVEVQVAWLPPAPAPITAINLDPPVSGPTLQNPPVRGSSVPVEVQVSWLPPAPAPIVAINLDPPTSGPAPQNPPFRGAGLSVEVQVSWLPPALAPQSARNLSPPISAPVATYVPVGARVPVEVQISWLPAPQVPVPPVLLVPQPAQVVAYSPVGAFVPTAVLVSWIVPTPAPQSATLLEPPVSGPAPQNPPVLGSRVPVEVQVAWLPPVLLPIIAFNGLAISGPVVQYNPVGSYVPAAVAISWLPVQVQPQSTPAFFTPSGPSAYQPMGAQMPAATRSWWDATWTIPQRAPTLVPTQVSFPFQGTRVSPEILRAWDQPSIPVQSRGLRVFPGPVPSQPPLGGGARVPQAVLVSWLPPAPAPISGSTGAVTGSHGYVFLSSWHVAIVPAKNKTALVPVKGKIAVVPAKSKTETPPR